MKQVQPFTTQGVYWLKVISLGIMLGFGIQFAQAWTPPSENPPGGNVSGPITTSSGGQIKKGNLSLNTDGAFANGLILNGSIAASGSSSGSGAITIKGSKGASGWSGIHFEDKNGISAGTLMMRGDYSGFYNKADNNWRWYVNDTGTSSQAGTAYARDFCINGTSNCLSTGGGSSGSSTADSGSVCGGCSSYGPAYPNWPCKGLNVCGGNCPAGYYYAPSSGSNSDNWVYSCIKS